MKTTLTVTPKMFTEIITGLIMSGVTFDAEEENGFIVITFLGGILKNEPSAAKFSY